jgi:hypothetical protein
VLCGENQGLEVRVSVVMQQRENKSETRVNKGEILMFASAQLCQTRRKCEAEYPRT